MTNVKMASARNVLVIDISQEIEDEDARAFGDKIGLIADRYGAVRLLITIKEYPSLNVAESLYDDLRFVKWHADKIEKMAVIGDRPYKKHWMAIFGLFSGILCEYFGRFQVKEAVAWLTS
jgi:hypothetical protein